MKTYIQPIKTILLAVILSFGISFVYAWAGPTATPPAGNTTAPINTSTDSQYKNGALGFGGLIHGYSNAIFDGNVGIGTTNPAQKLSVVGTIESTSGGIKFPNGTIQTTAATAGGISSVTTASCQNSYVTTPFTGESYCNVSCPSTYFRAGCGTSNGRDYYVNDNRVMFSYPSGDGCSCYYPNSGPGICVAYCAK